MVGEKYDRMAIKVCEGNRQAEEMAAQVQESGRTAEELRQYVAELEGIVKSSSTKMPEMQGHFDRYQQQHSMAETNDSTIEPVQIF